MKQSPPADMTAAKHPSTFIPRALLDEIRRHGYEAEQFRDLHPRQLEIIFREKWLKMFVPISHGGLGLSLPEALRVEEALSWADGSTAWVVTLCSGAGWFVGFLDPAISREVFADAHVCLAGSGAVTGTAEIIDGGYNINGSWKYASGSLHATMFTANCQITRGGSSIFNAKGEPLVSAFIFKKRRSGCAPDLEQHGNDRHGKSQFYRQRPESACQS